MSDERVVACRTLLIKRTFSSDELQRVHALPSPLAPTFFRYQRAQ